MSVKNHKFQCSPAEVCATLMMVSSGIRRIDMLFAGVEIEYSSVDKAVLRETLVIIDKYILPKAHTVIKQVERPKASAIIEEMKLIIADTVFEIQQTHNILVDLKVSFSIR